MNIRINSHLKPKTSQITPQEVYLRRREILKLGGIGMFSGLLPAMNASAGDKIYKDVSKSDFSVTDEITRYEDASRYNNFYEFGTGKDDPAENAHSLKPSPWSVTVEGECNKPGVYALEDLLKNVQLEERIYRLRCVEAWSMVIPWVGFELGSLLKRFEPTGNAKFIEFETLLDKSQMPGQRWPVLSWPYREGLRMDEAMHPLTLLAVGMYGETLPNQNGAPLRLVVPWKYGFKSIKSIVKIRFREDQPISSWTQSAPREYGFYSNVNPKKSHPRWSQSSERKITGERSLLSSIFQDREDTHMFNGYAEQVASLYTGMDLDKNF